MYENQTYEAILNRMLERVPSTLDKRPSALIWDTHSPTALELEAVYIELEYMIKNSYGDTAAREYLERLGKDRGLTPKEATYAVLEGVFTPSDIDVTGKRFSLGELNYVVLDQISEGVYRVQCETPGIIGNQYLGTLIPIEYIDGLETATLVGILIPGEDEEDTETFRQRYFDSFNNVSFGGNRADYLATVRAIQGVGDCKITRVWNGDISPSDMIPDSDVDTWYSGLDVSGSVKTWIDTVYEAAKEKKLTVGGTVLVTVVDSDDYSVPSDILIDEIQTALDPEQNAGEGYGLAPIGHVVNVKAAEAVEITVETNITFREGYSWSNLQSLIESAIEEYLLELRKEWADSSYLIVRIAQIETRILQVTGIIDITDTSINGAAENLELGEYQIPVFGGASEWQ